MQTLTINMNVPLKLSREGELFIATCPLLDIVTQGDTEETAKKNLQEALGLFFITCIEMDTFSEVLKQCGFQPINTQNGNQAATNYQEHIDVPLPFIAGQKLSECHA